jgi:phosphatidylinositol alpha-mannosyltransferase
MRIGIVFPYHMFRGGGVKEVVLALYDELTKRGHYVKIITPLPRDYRGDIPDNVITLGTSMDSTAFAGTAWQWSFSVDTSAIDEVFEREKFDVLHFHEPWIPVWSRQLVLRSKAAHVATLHARFYDTMTAKTVTTLVTPYVKPLVKHFDVYTAVSEAPLDYFRTLSKRPVTIIPNSIDIAKYQTRPKDLKVSKKANNDGPKNIFYIGRLEDRKGLKYLLLAFEELTAKHKNVQLTIAGSGVDESKLKEMVARNKIPRVEFLGFISEQDKIRYLHEADLFCSPAFYGESFGIVLLEAMAAGLPVVCGDNIGYISTMKDTGGISLVNPKDTVDFARRLEVFLYDEGLRRLWKRWAKTYIKQFTTAKIVDQYEKAYEQAIAHKDRRQHRVKSWLRFRRQPR